MAFAQVVETSVNNNSPSQDSNHLDDLFQSRSLVNKTALLELEIATYRYLSLQYYGFHGNPFRHHNNRQRIVSFKLQETVLTMAVRLTVC